MKKIFITLLLSMVLLSCERWEEGIARDIDLPPHNPQIATSLFIDSMDSTLSATISKTGGLFDTTKTGVIKNAEVKLYQDSALLHDLNDFSIDQTYDKFLSEQIGILEGELILEVNHPDFETVSATQSFPEKAVFTTEVDYGGTTYFDETSDALTIAFSDIPEENQHYLINIHAHYKSGITGQDTAEYFPLYLETTNQNATRINEYGFLLSEEGIDRNLAIRFATGINSINYLFQLEYRITVSTLSNELYKFYQSYSAFQNSQGNPFAEPVILYSNMSNDIGCFGVSTTLRKWDG